MEPFVPHSHKKILTILFCENLRIKIFVFVSFVYDFQSAVFITFGYYNPAGASHIFFAGTPACQEFAVRQPFNAK